jgi:hypothetical protein
MIFQFPAAIDTVSWSLDVTGKIRLAEVFLNSPWQIRVARMAPHWVLNLTLCDDIFKLPINRSLTYA